MPRNILATAVILIAAVLLLQPISAFACNGTDIALSKDPIADAFETYRSDDGISYFDASGDLLVSDSIPKISPSVARAVAEKFVKAQFDDPPLPLVFRKLEYVHGKLIYQFKSGKVPDINVKYHLGPVNFIVDYLVLDVDSATGNLYIANGCGAAPGQLLYKYNPDDFRSTPLSSGEVFVSNNTNFIARQTGNKIKVDGIIEPDEWANTGHRYFYLGDYKKHKPSEPHKNPMYYAEVWSQIAGDNIYFAIKTDTPYWVGILMKGDPNLGMLGAYTDAKVVRSNGEVTDRHFIQRKDSTFFLQPDVDDNIISSGAHQGDFYTYEYSFPLDSGDKDDIKLQKGKAYNILLAVGNTLDHYGIFTLDPAHKNHDHSKNNKAHVDVWSSTETTLRIGSAADRDIYGNAVTPVLASYTSGYDESKSSTHFHYANTHMIDFPARESASMLIGGFLTVSGLLAMILMFFMLRRNSVPATGCTQGGGGKDLFRYGWVKRLVTWKHFRTLFIVPTLLIFAAIILLGFMDIQDGRKNIATVYTWSIWWTMIIFSFIVLGRFWCMMCPFAALGDFVQKIVSFNRKLPKWLRNMGVQALGFIVLTLLFTMMALDSSPFITSMVISAILLAAVFFSIIYERRSFCRHLCPIGAVIGLYSTVTPFEVGPVDRQKCERHGRKTCAEACPMLEEPQEGGGSKVYCNFCMKCVGACPSGNLTLKLRPAGTELVEGRRRVPVGSLASLLLLGIITVETLAMTSVWAPLKKWVETFIGVSHDKLAYIAIFVTVVMLPLAVFYLLSWLLSIWLGKGKSETREILSNFAMVFIPLGISLHLAHNIQHLLLEGEIVVPATLRALEEIGIKHLWFINWNPSPLLGVKVLFGIQMTIIVAGFVFTMWLLYKKLKQYREPLTNLYKYTTAMSLYAITVIVSIVYVLGLPMNARHVH